MVENSFKLLRKFNFIGEILTLSDGGTILLDWYVNPNVPNDDDSKGLNDLTDV
jgi:hypothetical protein